MSNNRIIGIQIHLAIFITLLLLLPGTASAQKYSNEFLSIGVGARAQAMGNAVVASGRDVTSGVWNPAGLADPDWKNELQAGAMHAEWFAGVGKFDYIGVTLPTTRPERRIGLSLIRFGIDEIPNTLTLYESDGTINFENLREFSAADYALFFSYAARLQNKGRGQWLLGGNIKVVHRRIGPFANAWGFGLDAGAQYLRGNWRFALLGRDITSTFNAWKFRFTEEEKLALQLNDNALPINNIEITRPQLLLGASHYFRTGKVTGLLLEANAQITTDGPRNTLLASGLFSLDPGLGIELDFRKTVFVRAGVNQFQLEKGFDAIERLSPRPGIGVGLKFGGLQVDYAFTDLAADNATYSHIVSLMLRMERKKK